jgi:hypothetical protein
MESRMQQRRHIVAIAFVLLLALPLAAGETGRIVAVGDIHGNFEGWTSILREAGLIDEKNHWIGGDASYVQLGDIFDRGLEVRETLDLLMRLQDEAKSAGGRVECILGNHETMNLTSFYRDVNPEIYASFVDRKSEKRRKKTWSAVKTYKEIWGEVVDDTARQAWEAEHPLGWVEYTDSLAPKGVYGKWLRARPVGVMIDGILFIHGGVGPQVAGMSLEEINEAVANEIKTFDSARHYLVSKSLLPKTTSFTDVGFMVQYLILEAEKEDSTDLIRRHAEQLKPVAGIDDWYMMSPEGPLWFRGASRWSEEEHGEEMAALLEGIGAKAMVVGHTPDPEGTIRVRFSNRVFLIDTGMLSSYYEGGRPSALEIEDGVFTAIYLDGEREVLVGGEELDKAAAMPPGVRQVLIARK